MRPGVSESTLGGSHSVAASPLAIRPARNPRNLTSKSTGKVLDATCAPIWHTCPKHACVETSISRPRDYIAQPGIPWAPRCAELEDRAKAAVGGRRALASLRTPRRISALQNTRICGEGESLLEEWRRSVHGMSLQNHVWPYDPRGSSWKIRNAN